MTDQPIPDRNDGVPDRPRLGTEDAPFAAGTGEAATSDAGPGSPETESGDGSGTDATASGDAPKPSPDI